MLSVSCLFPLFSNTFKEIARDMDKADRKLYAFR